MWKAQDSIPSIVKKKERNRHFWKKDIWMANKHVRCLTSLVLSQKQIKTTVRYHFSSSKMAINNSNTLVRSREISTLIHYWWQCRMMQSLWKSCIFSKHETELPYNTAIFGSRYNQEKWKYVHKKTYAWIFTPTIFVTNKM